jgi:hypothetical protein
VENQDYVLLCLRLVHVSVAISTRICLSLCTRPVSGCLCASEASIGSVDCHREVRYLVNIGSHEAIEVLDCYPRHCEATGAPGGLPKADGSCRHAPTTYLE